MTEQIRKIDTTEAGFNLDKRIALEVMGWRELTEEEWLIVVKTRQADGLLYEFQEQCHIPRQLMNYVGDIKYIPAYSRNLVDAWLVIDRLKLKGFGFAVISDFVRFPADSDLIECKVYDRKGVLINNAIAESVPLAICRAALKMSEILKGEGK